MADPAIYLLRWSGTRRANLKKSLLIALALLVLPFSLVITSGTANAAVETEKSLNARLVTTPELTAGLKANGVTINIANTYEVPSIEDRDLVSSGRRWDLRDGSIMFTSLLSYRDGRALPSGDVNDVKSGLYAKNFAESFFDKGSVNLVATLDPIYDDRDSSYAIEANYEGRPLQAIITTFVRGNMVGLVFFATADNQGTEVISLFGIQEAKTN
jgi:hypothetical protein